MNPLTGELEILEGLLRKYGDLSRAGWIAEQRALFQQDEAAFWSKLDSLEWWGGPGSMADLSLYDAKKTVSGKDQKADNRRYRAVLISIYESMARQGIENIRGKAWIETFKEWQRLGL